MLTIREGARLQGFPDWFEFAGTEYEKYEQIGNAVAPLLGLALAGSVRDALDRGGGSARSVMGAEVLATAPAS